MHIDWARAIAKFEKDYGSLNPIVETWIQRHGLDILTTDPVWALNNLAFDLKRGYNAVYVVRCSNYEPAEIDSIWHNVSDAQKRCNELNEDWIVEEWPVG